MADTFDRLKSALADRYAIQEEIGAGGMATVYLAEDLKHHRRVAVKVLRPELAAIIGAERFLKEIEVTANLQHPHILPLHDSGEADGLLFYVIPYVAGGSLRDKLHAEGRLSLDDALGVARSVAGALDFAHKQGVIHRDVKPENILLHEGEAVVADFGIALAVQTVGGPRMTQAGFPLGTPHYMSPEQGSGDLEIGPATDIYALGCVVYECLVGAPPFTGLTAQSIISKRFTEDPPAIAEHRPDVPDAVGQAVARALARRPQDRFATSGDFVAALTSPGSPQSADQVEPVSSGQPSDPSPAGRVAGTVSSLDQEIRFCSARDGVSIAYAEIGDGPPLVKAANWLNHLEFDWRVPMWRHWLLDLARHNRLIRYDERGCGLSDWDVEDISFEAWVSDLEAVVDAVGLDRFALLGISQGGPIAMTYAARHPERVTRLVLHGTYLRGWGRRGLSDDALAQRNLELDLIRVGWGQKTSAFRQVFTTIFFPDAPVEQLDWFDELQRRSASPENAVRLMDAIGQIDVTDVAPQLSVPTLVLHCTDDARVAAKEGRRVASAIPGAKFVPLASKNHIPLESEPAWQEFLEAVRSFLGSEENEEGQR